MNTQEVFTHVKNHLLEQNAKAIQKNEHGIEDCCYLTEDDLRCAVGCLIPKEKYDPKIEGASMPPEITSIQAKDLRRQSYLFKDEYRKQMDLAEVLFECGVKEESFSLLVDLQHLHDNREVQDWSEFLQELATEYELEY